MIASKREKLFSRLSVSRGSFDRSAAVAVTSADLRLLHELIAKSLLRRSDFGRFESNHRWGLITALCRIGVAALALGDGAEARERFGEALDQAHALQAVSLELFALSGIGACFAEDPAEQERAAVILTFAMGHLPPSYAYAARPALDRLEAELPPGQLAAAREAAAAATLEELERTTLQPV